MTATHEIHIAYSYSPKFRNYFAAAYVLERGNPGLPSETTFRFALTTGTGDTAKEAEDEALFRATTGVPRATNVTGIQRHGRKPHILVQGYAFP